jgi:hypothetical protein
LKKHAEFLPDFVQRALAELGDVAGVDQNAAAIGKQERVQVFQQNGLARAAAADNRGNLSGFKFDVDSPEYLLTAKGFVQVDDADHVTT